MMTHRRLIAVLIVASFLLLVSCGTDIKTGIIGEWKGETVKQDFHFYSDGKVELNDLKYSMYTGTYTITDGNTLNCTFENPIFKEPVVMKAKIDGNKLTLTSDTGRKEIYVRK